MSEQTKPMPCAVCGGDDIDTNRKRDRVTAPACRNRGQQSIGVDDWNREQRLILATRHWQAVVSALQGSAALVAAETGKVATEARALRLVEAAKAIADAAVKR